MHTEEVNLKHILTDQEMAGLARQQSSALGRKAAAEGELAAIKKDFGGRIALAQAEVQNCSQAVNTGWEMRNIKCLLLDERPEGFRLIVRADNGAVAKRRKLEPAERQMKLTDDPPREYFASALLPVEDEAWATDVCQVPLYQDEVELLRMADPPIQFGPPPGRNRQIEAPASDPPPAEEKRGRGRPPTGKKGKK